MKRMILVVAAAVAFLVGYGGATQAWPGVPDRNRWYGYFDNRLDDTGGYVLPNGIPSSVNSPASLIAHIRWCLQWGSAREKTGAAFLVHTMTGSPYNRDRVPTVEQMDLWESLIYYADSNGYITWFFGFSYTWNSYWQGTQTGMNWDDDAYYTDSGSQTSIRFRNGAWQTIYAIRRVCANPVGDMNSGGLEKLYNTGGTSSVPPTSTPGQTITFAHNVQNIGPTGFDGWWGPREGAGTASTGLPQPTYPKYFPDYSTSYYDENFTIPSNAAAGTRYCRLFAWTPTNSWGGVDGRTTEACTTVQILAKLKAAMTASPKPIQPGDTITFTPGISATTNASPIVVNCSINRTLFPPGGGSSNLGAQPCVDSTGNANITIPPGGSVSLRQNNYVSADTLAVGTRVCDTITITNPSGAGYYTVPADQSAQDCSTVAKAPYVHFLGADVWAGGGFAAVTPACNTSAKITTVTRSRTVADGTTPGSGVKYAAFALGKITNFGTGNVANVVATGAGDNWTFSNINSANLGFFGAAQHCINDYSSVYASLPLSAPPGINNAVSGAWHVAGPINLAGTMPLGDQPGGRKVYFVEGDVTINGPIRYPATYASAAQIPSLVVIATGNIRVLDTVNQIDGIYMTRGTFQTCYPKVEPATISTCNVQLTVNGAVMATTLDLHRTAGAEGATPAAQKAAAEVFNLSPELYLTNALNQTTQTIITTSNIRELPPRF